MFRLIMKDNKVVIIKQVIDGIEYTDFFLFRKS